MRRMQGRGFASGWGFLALVLVAGAAWALTSWGLPEGAQAWLSSDTGVAQLGVSPDGTMALSTLLAGGGWLTADAASGGLWLLDKKDHLIALGPDGAVGKPLDLAPALGSAQPLGVAVDGTADAAWVVTPDQLITVVLESAQIQRTPLPAGVVAWTQDAAQHTLWLVSDHRLTEYDARGRTMTSFALPDAPTAMTYDASSGQIWLAFANNQLARYTSSGQQTLQAPRPTMAAGPMAADGTGGLWIAGRTHVVHLDAEGFVLVRTAVMPETDASAVSMPAAGIQALAVDPVSHGVWVKTPTALVALDAAGRMVQSVPINGAMAAGTFRSLALRAMPPTGPPASPGPSPVQPTPTGGINTSAIANIPAHSGSITSNTARHAGSAALQPCARGSSASICAPVTAGTPTHPPARILWVAAGHDLYQLLPPASSAQALDRLPQPQTVAVDPTDGALWAYRHGQLWSVSPAGVVTVDVKLAAKQGDDEGGRSSLAVDGSDAVVWLAVGRNLMRLDSTGKLLGTITLTHGANGISLDTATGQLWVAEHHGLEAFDPSGSLLFTTTVQGAIRALDADAHLDAVWVATNRDLLRLSATGQVQLTVKMHGDTDRRMAADGQGGLWIAGGPTLSHVDTGGSIGFSLQPFGSATDHADHGQRRDAKAEGGAIRALAADPLTHAVWVEGRHRLVEESLSGQPLAAIDSRTWSRIDESESHPDHDDTQRHALGPMALYVDTIPPVLTLVSPAAGTYTNQPQLPLSFSYSDVGSGVDPSTLTIQNTATGQPLAVSCQTTAGTAICTPTSPLADGNYALSATVQDYAGNASKPVALQFTIDTVPPTITITAPTRTLTNQPDLTLAGTLSKIATLTVNGQPTTVNSTLQFSLPITLTEGTNTYTLVATDRAGNVTTTTLTITLDTVPPPQPDLGLFNVAGPVNGQVTVTGKAGSVQGGDTVTLTDTVTGATVSVTANADGSFTATLAAGASDPISVSVEDPAGNVTQAPTTIEASNLPPSPSTEAPQLPPTEQAPFVDQVSFLYSGSNPIQTGVAPGTIQPLRVAIVRGQVLDRANQPLSGVTVTVLGHPEYGQTLTRASGWFDLAVNGGGSVVLNFTRNGYLMAQRTVSVPWGNFAIAQPLVMIQPDPVATPVTFGSTAMQVAQGSVQVGQSGTRQATVFIPAGTTATEVLPNGTTQPLASGHLRATEFTVGANGPQAMPAALPATSAYTYALDLSLDEAQTAGATTVQFSKPLPVYVNNFLGVAIGTRVPSGWYDPTVGSWKGSVDGVVVKFLGVDANGDAELDVTGSDTPATANQLSAYGISTAELAEIAKTFTPGQSFWRELVTHFTYWDFNFGYNPKANDYLPPGVPSLPGHPPIQPTEHDHQCTGCQVDAENQRVGLDVNVVGTPYKLHYESPQLRTNTISFPVTTASPPGNSEITNIEVTVTIAGRQVVEDFDPTIPNQTFTWTWNGLNVYGEPVYANEPLSPGCQCSADYNSTIASISLAYELKMSYGAFIGSGLANQATFGQSENTSMGVVGFAHAYSNINLIAATRIWSVQLGGAIEQSPLGLQGWTLNDQDSYDFSNQALVTGSGQIRYGMLGGSGYIANSIVGDGLLPPTSGLTTATNAHRISLGDPSMVQVAPDGSMFVWDAYESCIIRVDTSGQATPFAGECGTSGISTQPATYSKTPTLATTQPLDAVIAMTSDLKGGLYVVTQGEIVHLDKNDNATLVAGGGPQAIASWTDVDTVNLSCVNGIAANADGSVWFLCDHASVWRIDQSGLLQEEYAAPSGTNLNAIAIAGAGQIYLAGGTGYDGAVWQFMPNDSLQQLAGVVSLTASNNSPFSAVPSPALGTSLQYVTVLSATPDGSIIGFMPNSSEGGWFKLTGSGVIACIASCAGNSGNSPAYFVGNGTSASTLTSIYNNAFLHTNLNGSIGPDGHLYIPDVENGRILSISSTYPARAVGDFYVASNSGMYADEFNATGEEVARYDTATWTPVLRFSYNQAGLLSSITDTSGNVTTIQRDGNGSPVSITSSFGQVTKLSATSEGNLTSVTDPAGNQWRFGYDVNGQLVKMTDPRGELNQYAYDNNGRLVSDLEANGGGWTLSHSPVGDYAGYPYQVTMSTAGGRTYQFALSENSQGISDVETLPYGLTTTTLYTPWNEIDETLPDGTTVSSTISPDPRFGAESGYNASSTITLPAGQVVTESEARTANSLTLGAPGQLEWQWARPAGLGPSVSETFDPASNAWSLDRDGVTTTIAVDALDRPTTITYPTVAPFAIAYTAQGQVAAVTQSGGGSTHLTSYKYYSSGPAAGLLESATDPVGLTTSYQYDADGRVTSETLPDGNLISFSYDADGNVTSITPPGEQLHSFAYNAVNQTIADESPITQGSAPLSFKYSYNIDRELTGIDLPDGSIISLTYDGGGRLSQVSLPGLGSYLYSYDASTGQLSSISAPDNELLSESWDGFLNIQTQWSGAISGTVARSFDSNLQLSAITIDGTSTQQYSYDGNGRLALTGNSSGTLEIWRGPASGRIDSTVYPGAPFPTAVTTSTISSITRAMTLKTHTAVPEAIVCGSSCGPPPASTMVSTARQYDAFDNLSELSATSFGTLVYQDAFTRDADGRITQAVEDQNGVTTTWGYTYDTRGRLASVSENGSVVGTYGYDANGNRISVNGQTVATYNADDQLTSYNGVPYTYAADGSLASAGSTTYQYDALGHLLEVKTPSETITYTYDGLGRRVGKSINGTLVQGFLYADGIHPVAELDGQGNVVATFVYGTRPNVPDLMIKGGVTYRIISDPLGSPVEVINTATGAVVEQISYDAWGSITSDTNPGFQPFGFAGGLYDADTGLVHFGARDYDPVIGRWTTRDPLGFAGGNTNLYGYVLQDPINAFDPYGTFTLPTLNQGFVDFTAGFGDSLVKTLTFGYGDLAATRQFLGIDGANECSAFYHSGAASGAAYGMGLEAAAFAYAPVAIASYSASGGRAALLAASLYIGDGGGDLASYMAAQQEASTIGLTVQYDVATTPLWLNP